MIRQKRCGGITVLLVAVVMTWVGLATPQATALADSDRASVRVNPSTVPQNSAVQIQLKGFRPGEKVSVWRTLPGSDPSLCNGPTYAIGNYEVNAKGESTFTWKVAGTNPVGCYVIGARGNSSLRTASTQLWVTQGEVPRWSRMVDMKVDTPEVPQGQTLRVSALGFRPGERIGVWITRPDSSVRDMGTVIASREGGLDFSFRPDASYVPGVYYISAQGKESGILGISPIQVIVGKEIVREVRPPRIIIEPQQAQKAGWIKVEGINFGLNEKVSIWTTSVDAQTVHNLGKLSGKARQPLEVKTEHDGFFVRVIDLPPELPAGRHILTVRGHMSGLTVKSEFFILP